MGDILEKDSFLFIEGLPLPPDWKFLLLLRRTTSDDKCGAGVLQQTIFPELAGLGFNRSILYGRPP